MCRAIVVACSALAFAAAPISAAQGPAQSTGQATAAPASAAPQPHAAAPAVKEAPAPAEPYVYEPAGRRDPFVSLLGTGGDTRVQTGRRVDGPSGLSAAELSVSGVLQSRGSMLAMVTGPDKKTYIVHAGEKLLDGTIKTITPQGLVIVQEVNDPLSLVKQREVRKLLRSLEDSK